MAKKSVWECPMPTCRNKITLHVKPSHAPTCSKHTGKGTVMKQLEQ